MFTVNFFPSLLQSPKGQFSKLAFHMQMFYSWSLNISSFSKDKAWVCTSPLSVSLTLRHFPSRCFRTRWWKKMKKRWIKLPPFLPTQEIICFKKYFSKKLHRSINTMTTHQLKRLLPLFTLLKLPKSTIKQQPQKTTNIFAASWMSVRSSYSYFPSSYWLSLTCKFYHQKKVKKIIRNIGILYFHTARLHRFMAFT